MTLRLDRFLNYVYNWSVSHMNKEQREDFDQQLTMPLPVPKTNRKRSARIAKPTPAELASEGDDFMAFMGQVNSR